MRISFETNNTVNMMPFASSNPDLPKGEVPYMPYGDELRYAIYGTLLKSGIRRAGAKIMVGMKRQLDPTFKMDIDTVRLLLIGGVKGSGASAHPNPTVLKEVRKGNPHLELFGSGAPAMTGGCLIMGIMMSTTVILATVNQFGRVEFNKNTKLPIIRRSLLNDPSVNMSDISDPEKMMGDAALNRIRSICQKEINTWSRLHAKSQREPLTKRELAMVQTAKETLKAQLGHEYLTVEEATTGFDAFRENMMAGGTSDVAEANLHSVVVVPPNTVWKHKFELLHPSALAVGLFMEAWNHKTLFAPYIGGNISRGCGGYLHGTYTVKRQPDDSGEWIEDCTVEVRPDHGIILDGFGSSYLRTCWEEWKEADINTMTFDFGEISRILNESNGNGDA
jgi:hypothetical protein